MKKLTQHFTVRILVVTLILTSIGCSEVPIVIDNGGTNNGPDITELSTQPRIVFVEEITGVACTNCPPATKNLHNILDNNEDRIVISTIHEGRFANPFSSSTQDLRVEDGASLLGLLSQPLGYPSALINRKQFENNQNFYVFDSDWAGYINEEILNEPKVAVAVDAEITSGNKIKIDLQFLAKEIVPDGLRLTIGLTESGIVEPQKSQDEIILDYVHDYVLRDILTPINGIALSELTVDEVTELELEFDLPEGVIVENCEIFAVVHEVSPTLEVYQANKTKITQ